jgi:hypothetical protein
MCLVGLRGYSQDLYQYTGPNVSDLSSALKGIVWITTTAKWRHFKTYGCNVTENSYNFLEPFNTYICMYMCV